MLLKFLYLQAHENNGGGDNVETLWVNVDTGITVSCRRCDILSTFWVPEGYVYLNTNKTKV